MSSKRKRILISLIAVIGVFVIGGLTVTYGWFLTRYSSDYSFVLKSDDHIILQYETDLTFANNDSSEEDQNCLIPAVSELTFGANEKVYEPIEMFDENVVSEVATAAHFHSKSAFWTGSSVDPGELSFSLSAFVKGGSSAYDLVEWGEIDYIAIFSYLWEDEDSDKKILYYDGEWYSDIADQSAPLVVPASVTGDETLTTWYVLTDEEKVKTVNSIKYPIMAPNREFELDLYAFVAKTDELLDPSINGKTISLSATINERSAFIDLGDNTMKFGSYPQTLVVNSQIERKLNELAGALPTASDPKDWTSYNAYFSAPYGREFMWYIDVVFRGEKYRGVYFTQYRPYYTDRGFNSDSSWQDDNGYNTSTVYWFKFDQLKWRILNKANGEAFLLAENVIDAQTIGKYRYVDGHYYLLKYENGQFVEDRNYYSNNYKYSHIRRWLNASFYNTAFDGDQKDLIVTKTVDNTARSTNLNGNAKSFGNGVNNYACEDTPDNVFLLSVQEASNTNYGFAADAGDSQGRCKQATDYAKAQGIAVISNGNSRWYLRSPYHYTEYIMRYVSNTGSHTSGFNVIGTCEAGIVPALYIKLA